MSPRVPGLAAGYRRSWLRGDVLAGLTVAAYLIPQVMAYGTVAGLPPVAGLWAIMPALVAYALLGSSRQLSIGPESTTALMTAVAVGPLAGGDPGRYAALAAALAVLVGVLCLAAWAVRLGFVADLLSKPILVGYLAGVALVMMVGQLSKLTGVPVSGDAFFEQVVSFLGGLGRTDVGTALFAALVLAFLFLAQWRFPALPVPLLAVLLATATVVAFDLDRRGIDVVGPVPGGLPRPDLPSPADLRSLLLPALGILIVGYTDNILTGRAFALAGSATSGAAPRPGQGVALAGSATSGAAPRPGQGVALAGSATSGAAPRPGQGVAFRGGYEIDANRELLALGTANIGAGLFRGFPVSSSGSRTALGASAGSHTQVYSLVALACVIATLLFLGPLLARFPMAVLGAIVVYAAVRLIDLPGFRRLASFRRSELVLALATLVGVLVFNILYGVLLAVALSVAEMLYRVARPHDGILGRVPGLAGMHDIDDYSQAQTIPGLVVYRYEAPLFFANAENFRQRALAAVDQGGDVGWFLLNAEANVEVDITALDAVEALRAELARRGIVFAVARVKQDLRDELDAYGLTASVGEDRIFPTLPTAVAAYEEWARVRRAPEAG